MSDTGTTTITAPTGSTAEREAAERAKRRQEIQDRKQQILSEWDKAAPQGSPDRYKDIDEAAKWAGEEGGSGWGPFGWAADKASGAVEAVGEKIGVGAGRGSPRPEVDERSKFSDERLPSGRRRSQVMDEYTALVKEEEELDAKSAAMGFTEDKEASLFSGLKSESNEASIWLRTKRLIPIITDAELEDMARTGQLDLTPEFIATQYLKTIADPETGDPINVPDTGAFTDPLSGANVRFDRADMDLEAELRKTEDMLSKYVNGPNGDPAGGVGLRGGIAAVNRQRQRKDLLKEPMSSGPKSLREAFARPYRMSKDQLASLGVSLFEAGYMEVPNWDPKKPLSVQTALGDPYNPEFQKAYQRWMLDTFRDRTKSATEILDERKKANKPVFDDIAAEMAKEKAKRLAQVTRLSDPLALRQAAESFAKQILGREFISEGEINSLIGMVHGQQTAYGQAVVAAEESGTGPTAITEVDPEAQLRAALEANHPVEAEAYATAGQYENFLSMIGAAGGRI